MAAKKNFVLRIDEATYAALEKWAADEFRSVNGQLEWIISRALKEAGRERAAKEMPAGPDAIGAGDSFLAALLALLQRQNALRGEALLQLSAAALQEALHYANRAAAIACSRSGGTDPPALLDLVG